MTVVHVAARLFGREHEGLGESFALADHPVMPPFHTAVRSGRFAGLAARLAGLRRKRSPTVVASLGKRHMAETTLERARAIAAARSYLAEFRTLAAKYAANVERALGREGMCEVSGIAMEVREMVEVMKDRTLLPL
jgi:hypothetical protein